MGCPRHDPDFWTAPAMELSDELCEMWFARTGLDVDGETLADAENWATEMIGRYAR